MRSQVPIPSFAVALGLLLLIAYSGPVQAQEDGTYTVVPGDTLSRIAAQFGTSLDNLIAVNAIQDPNRLVVGQQLIIPDASGAIPVSAIPTGTVLAAPGDTIGVLAARYGQDPTLVAELNGRTTATRLFPGQPVDLPADVATPTPLRFGAVTAVDAAQSIVQGRTGRIYVALERPVELSGTWLGGDLVFTAIGGDPLRQFAFLPVDPLQEEGSYAVSLTYLTSQGIAVSRAWPVTVETGPYTFQEIVVSDEKAASLTSEVVQAEREKVTGVWSEVSPDLLWLEPFERPINLQYATTSPFGTRRTYSVADIGNFHAGQDFGSPEGALIVAPAVGIVRLAEPLPVRGNAVIVDHGRGVFTGYWHMSEIAVEPGEVVSPGDVLGLVGNTGLSTGAHLHWELRIDGIAVDPMQFLEEAPFAP